jgi:hypothetical protein
MLKEKNRWVAGHPQKALGAIRGGQDHPLMGIEGGLATPIFTGGGRATSRGPRRGSLGVVRPPI